MVKESQKNDTLEKRLDYLNLILSNAEMTALKNIFSMKNFPIFFILGAPRSGSTLVTQLLAKSDSLIYPSNFLSRFYQNPIIGSLIQEILTSEELRVENEFDDIEKSIPLISNKGKTVGLLSPNEFWYFWKAKIPNLDLYNFNETNDLLKYADIEGIRNSIDGITSIFQKPFFMKGMMFNQNIDFLEEVFFEPYYIYTKRDFSNNLESLLQARERHFGDRSTWYSFKIKQYGKLSHYKKSDYQVGGQIYYTNKTISQGLKNVDESRIITINYESLCSNPHSLYDKISEKLRHHSLKFDTSKLPKKLNPTRAINSKYSHIKDFFDERVKC